MTSRIPTDNEEPITPMLGWEQAMAALQRNLLQQQHQQHQQQQQQQQQHQQQHNNSLNQAAAAAIAAGLTPPTSLSQGGIPSLWPYNLGGTAGGMIPPAAAAAAASLASLGNPANNYLNHLQTMHSPENLLSFQQNLLLLEQLQQQRQLLAANPHLLMAVAAAQGPNASLSPQSQLTNGVNGHHHQHLLANPNLQIPANLLLQHQLQAQHHLNGGSPKFDGVPTSQNSTIGGNSAGSSSSSTSSHSSGNGLNNNNNNSLLTTVNSALTNQHQDSLVDQHFRRSLGEDYNQIMSAKADNKINVGK